MNAAQIKDEIRKLNRIDKIEIYRWIDGEVAGDLFWRIGMDRSLQIRQEIKQTCQVTIPKRRVYIGNAERDSGGYADQASQGR